MTTFRLSGLFLILAVAAFGQSYRYVQAPIAAGASLSTAATLRYCSPVRLEVPTKTDGVLTFQISEDGVTYRDLYDEFGSVVTVTASTGNRSIRLNPSEWWNTLHLKIRSGTPSAAVNQVGAITIGVVCQMVYPQ